MTDTSTLIAQAEKKVRSARLHGRWKHGMCGTRIYRIWGNMKMRCYNPNNTYYQRYGGRGITICERWLDFGSFFADIGDAPPNMQLDRIDNDGNYEPGNVRWATCLENQSHRSDNRQIEFEGRVQHLSEWARELGIDKATLCFRLNRWSVREALTLPVRVKRPHLQSNSK